jgi:hypothetical protein
MHSVNYAAKLVQTRRILSSTNQLSSGAGLRLALQPSWSLLTSLFFVWWRSLTVPGTKMAPFLWLMWGVVFYCTHAKLSFFLSEVSQRHRSKLKLKPVCRQFKHSHSWNCKPCLDPSYYFHPTNLTSKFLPAWLPRVQLWVACRPGLGVALSAALAPPQPAAIFVIACRLKRINSM